jgi:hypothetical protein
LSLQVDRRVWLNNPQGIHAYVPGQSGSYHCLPPRFPAPAIGQYSCSFRERGWAMVGFGESVRRRRPKGFHPTASPRPPTASSRPETYQLARHRQRRRRKWG